MLVTSPRGVGQGSDRVAAWLSSLEKRLGWALIRRKAGWPKGGPTKMYSDPLFCTRAKERYGELLLRAAKTLLGPLGWWVAHIQSWVG